MMLLRDNKKIERNEDAKTQDQEIEVFDIYANQKNKAQKNTMKFLKETMDNRESSLSSKGQAFSVKNESLLLKKIPLTTRDSN